MAFLSARSLFLAKTSYMIETRGALGLYPHFRVIKSVVEAVTTSEETSGAAAQKVAEAVMKASEPLGP